MSKQRVITKETEKMALYLIKKGYHAKEITETLKLTKTHIYIIANRNGLKIKKTTKKSCSNEEIGGYSRILEEYKNGKIDLEAENDLNINYLKLILKMFEGDGEEHIYVPKIIDIYPGEAGSYVRERNVG